MALDQPGDAMQEIRWFQRLAAFATRRAAVLHARLLLLSFSCFTPRALKNTSLLPFSRHPRPHPKPTGLCSGPSDAIPPIPSPPKHCWIPFASKGALKRPSKYASQAEGEDLFGS